MSTQGLGNELLNVGKTTKKNNTSSSNTSEPKQTPSLFDNLLKSASKESETSISGKESSTKDLQNQNKNNQIKTNSDTKESSKVVENKTVVAKEEIKENPKSTTKESMKQPSLMDKIISENKKPEVKEESLKKVNSNEETPKEVKKETAKPTSLMDKIISENKSAVDTKESSKVVENKTVVAKEEIKENPKSTSKESIKQPSLMDKIISENKKPEVKEESLKKVNSNEETPKEVKKETAKPTSLMDKMINESTHLSHETTDNKNTFKNKKENNSKSTIGELQVQTKSKESASTDKKVINNINEINNKNEKVISTQNNTNETSSQVNNKNSVASELDKKQLLHLDKYLHEQKRSKDIASHGAQTEAKKVLSESKEGTSSVQKAAQILELNPKEVAIDTTNQIEEKIDKKQLDQFVFKKSYSVLNRVYLQETNKALENNTQSLNATSTTSNEVTTNDNTPNVELKIERSMVEVFTSKIIASKQKLDSFMSDVARQMYQNYKPPVTAFRINLNPATLGSIAILIKSNKADSSMNISMNFAQANTFEVMSDNKTSLQQAITRNFTNESNISLDLSFNENNQSNDSYEQEKQEQSDSNVAKKQTNQNQQENQIEDSAATEYM
jgi:hypothetical protein